MTTPRKRGTLKICLILLATALAGSLVWYMVKKYPYIKDNFIEAVKELKEFLYDIIPH